MTGEPIAIVRYDPKWPHRFEAERSLLERVLAPWLDGGIHHAGSTAIPGLASKPIIDIVASVRDLEEARVAFDPLREQSYRYASSPTATRLTGRESPTISPSSRLSGRK